jgi:inosine-uridine nucleoside N-ribohydrolase
MDPIEIGEVFRVERLAQPRGKLQMVLDTDTYNEIDDQFAVVYALLSPDELDVQAIYAAPFHNSRSENPADGMEKSYEEILRLLDRLGVPYDGFAFRGARGYIEEAQRSQPSAAVQDLVERAMANRSEPLYVVAIGAITNVASAILLEPSIVEHIVVVWLGGHATHWPHTREFNLMQDIAASRLVLDCGVPLVRVPCMGVTSHLTTTVAEIERFVQGRGSIGDYLARIFREYQDDHFAWSKELWDVATIGFLIHPTWVPTDLVHSPVLTDQLTWSVDHSRHLIREANFVRRDPIFRDLFSKLAAQ